MLFGPDQSPRTVFPREFSIDFVDSVVIFNPILKIVGVADVEMASWILQEVYTIIHQNAVGSSGRIRTYDQSVNSRPLYH